MKVCSLVMEHFPQRYHIADPKIAIFFLVFNKKIGLAFMVLTISMESQALKRYCNTKIRVQWFMVYPLYT